MTIFSRPRSGQAAFLILAAMVMTAGGAAADQVIADDLIVQGSTCVGLDCVNNENFGFDTIKLKENNLRIFFEDTSVSPGFPANDWRLIANDSASGGANFFSIQDATANRQVFTVTAGAPSNSIFVASTGNVGLGTATPVLDLSIRTNNTPAHRLEQDNSGGFAAQTWDIAGNEANFFIRDVTNGSRLPFRIRPGAPSSSIDIQGNGRVGIATAAPNGILSVAGTGLLQEWKTAVIGAGRKNWGVATEQAVTGDWQLRVSALDNGVPDTAIMVAQSSGVVGIGVVIPQAQFHTTGTVRFEGVANCGAGIQSDAVGNLSCLVSSQQFKHVAGDLEPSAALTNVMALRPQVGSYRNSPDVPEHWLIAEQVAAVDPALVGLKDGKPYTVKTQNVVADLIAVVQQQQRRIDQLERLVAAKQ
jgi:hypothetical protein